MQRYFRIALMILIPPTILNATAAPYPVVTSIRTTITSSTSALYDVTLDILDVPGASQPVPAGWLVGFGHRHDAFPGGSDTARVSGDYAICAAGIECGVKAKAGDTMSSAALRAFSKSARSGVAQHRGKGNGGECVGYLGVRISGVPWSQAIFPPGTCVYAPPGRDWCEITEPTLEIDHGSIRLTNGGTDQKKEPVTVNCTAPMTMKLVFGQDILTLAPGIKSKLTTQFPGGTQWVRMRAGDNLGSVVSGLSLQGAKAGTYSASTIMYVIYP